MPSARLFRSRFGERLSDLVAVLRAIFQTLV
jgi:hypothetical protein